MPWKSVPRAQRYLGIIVGTEKNRIQGQIPPKICHCLRFLRVKISETLRWEPRLRNAAKHENWRKKAALGVFLRVKYFKDDRGCPKNHEIRSSPGKSHLRKGEAEQRRKDTKIKVRILQTAKFEKSRCSISPLPSPPTEAPPPNQIAADLRRTERKIQSAAQRGETSNISRERRILRSRRARRVLISYFSLPKERLGAGSAAPARRGG